MIYLVSLDSDNRSYTSGITRMEGVEMSEISRALEIIEANLDILEEEPASVTGEEFKQLLGVSGRLQVLRGLLAMRFSTEPEDVQHPMIGRLY